MKKTLTLVLLVLALFLLAAAAGAEYVHDPRLNPSAMADIVWDPDAVYGYSPSPDGSLAAYAAFDWTDPELVNGENGRLARIAYHESILDMYIILDDMRAEGKSTEEIARAVSEKRNEIRLAAYDGDPDGLAIAKERNLEKYGREEGPLPEDLFEQYGSWETVLWKAFSARRPPPPANTPPQPSRMPSGSAPRKRDPRPPCSPTTPASAPGMPPPSNPLPPAGSCEAMRTDP